MSVVFLFNHIVFRKYAGHGSFAPVTIFLTLKFSNPFLICSHEL